MLKKELEDGMILETKKGQRHLLTNGVMRDHYGYLLLKSYSEDLKNIYDEDFNIVKVYKDTGRFSLQDIFKDRNLTIIWERKEIDITNGREVEVLKALKTLDFKWIARDISGLFAFGNKPEKLERTWYSDYYWYPMQKDENIFNFIKLTDKEPTIVDDLLKGL